MQAMGSPRRLMIAAPYGGQLVDLLASPARAAALKKASHTFPSIDLTSRQLGDLELLITGAFSPLCGFMDKADYESVCSTMRLANGILWPIPITLEVSETIAEHWQAGERIALRDLEGTMIAALALTQLWKPDKALEADKIFGTTSETHPEVRYLFNNMRGIYIAGKIEAIQLPTHYDFVALRRTPAAVRASLSVRNFTRIVGFQTTKLMHRAHVEFTRRAAAANQAGLLINAVAGAEAMDTNYFSRIRSYQAILAHYEPQTVRLNLIQLARRLCGPREALWHAIINKNYGSSHFIVEHDYAGQGDQANGAPLYGRYSAQGLLAQHADEIGIKLIPFRDLVPEEDRVELFITNGGSPLKADADRQRERECAEWFSYPSVIAELRRSIPNRARQGFTVFFTGLSGAGKSTIANILQAKLLECSNRQVTLLDGDLVRKRLSAELGFSREHRDINVQRIGYVASLITKNHGAAICAPIAPYAQTRAEVRAMIEACGGFIEVYVATSLQVCETRDHKGLYAKARAGLVKEFTGIDSPYEIPARPEMVIDTSDISAEQAADQILHYLINAGFIKQSIVEHEGKSNITGVKIRQVLALAAAGAPGPDRMT